MDLKLPIIFAQGALLLRRKILITKEHHTSLSNQESQLILLFVSQIFELQASDLSSNMIGNVDNLFSDIKKCLFLGVGTKACVNKFLGFVAYLLNILDIKELTWSVWISITEINVCFLEALTCWSRNRKFMSYWFFSVFDEGENRRV
jgi:hypothetical protein